MNFFKQFAGLVQAGVVFQLTMRAAGDKMQVDILPQADTGKTGIVMPPKSFVATAAEFDAEMPGFLEGYLAATAAIQDQFAAASTEMAAAVEAAKQAAKKATTAKAESPKASSARSVSTVVPGAQPKRDLTAGMLDDEDDDSTGGETVSLPKQDPVDTSAADAGGMDKSLFML